MLSKVNRMTFSRTWIRRSGDRYRTLVVMALLFSWTVGCGPSRQELMMRQAQRARDDKEEEAPHKELKVVKPPPAEVAKPKPKPQVQDIAEEPKPEDADGEKVVRKGLIPIEERQPETPLTPEQRRQKAYDNLSAVSKALLAYAKARGSLPRTYVTANGFDTVSWRVEILPFLGYEELYKKFDPNVPWNKPPNDELLKFIPDEYVSPERFDVETNIAIPSGGSFIGDPRLRGAHLDEGVVEDGLANTLLLVETRESRPWSAPLDFAPGSPKAARDGLLGLREDGAFAVWANGWLVLLANELQERLFWDMMTVASGGGLQAGKVHRDIPLKQTEAALAADRKETTPLQPIEETSPNAKPPAAAKIPANVRETVPIAAEVAAAQAKLRKIFADKIRYATTIDRKRTLSSEMLTTSSKMSDSAEAYALETAAMRMAIDGGGSKQLIEAIDHRILRFEVDAYEENMVNLLAFGNENNSKNLDLIEKDGFLERAVHVVYAAIVDDDFVRAASLLRIAYRYLDQPRYENLPKDVNRLRTQLANAQRYYDKTKDYLVSYRDDPDDGEAAAVIGRFLCFVKGDWETGIPLLAKGGPEMLRELAKADLAGPGDDYLDKIALADSWWDLSTQTTTGIFRQSARDRALHWYEQVYRTMPQSLDRMHVKARIDEAEREEAGSPLELVRRLAKHVNIDLSISLAATPRHEHTANR